MGCSRWSILLSALQAASANYAQHPNHPAEGTLDLLVDFIIELEVLRSMTGFDIFDVIDDLPIPQKL